MNNLLISILKDSVPAFQNKQPILKPLQYKKGEMGGSHWTRCLFPVFACSQDPCLMSGAWRRWNSGKRGVRCIPSETVSPQDPPEAGCSAAIVLLPVWMETQTQALYWGSPSHTYTQPPHPQTPPGLGTAHPAPPALCCPPPRFCFPPWPLIAFMPLFSQCEKFDNVHKRNSRIAAGYGKSTCGSSLLPLWRRLGICSFIDLFWAEKDVAIKAQGPLPLACALQGLNPLFLGPVALHRVMFCGMNCPCVPHWFVQILV